MLARNPHFSNLKSSYLFGEITERKNAFKAANPGVRLLDLGVGDTTLPLPPTVARAMEEEAKSLGTATGYKGYGPELGPQDLRAALAANWYHGKISADEVLISEGTKGDIARLMTLFGSGLTIGVQNPTYPMFRDLALLAGHKVVYYDCLPDNGFFPHFSQVRCDVLFFCAPNNPTGVAATRAQLETLVAWALKEGVVVVFDTAYSAFVRSKGLIRSLYEIPGAERCCIEMGSFSKMVGFTGVRLGWTVCPKALLYACGSSVLVDHKRNHATAFNGASRVTLAGGLATLSPAGLQEADGLISHYLQNAALLKKGLQAKGWEVFGGVDSPYLWVRSGYALSWEAFDHLLNDCQIVCVPGSGFGSAGQGFVRLSAFAKREDCEEVVSRLS